MARKVNIKLVGSIVAVAVVMAVGLGVVWKMRHKDPKVFIARGDALLAEGKYDEAGKHYATAAMMLKDPTLWLKAGNVYNGIAYDDVDNLHKAVSMWNQAIAIDPGYAPALKQLLDIYQEDLDLSDGPAKAEKFDGPRDCAEKLLKADPDNKAAKAMLPMLVIRAWLSNIETDPQKVDQAMKDLGDQLKADPANADVGFFLAEALLKKGDMNANAVGAPTGEGLYADAIKQMDDALKGQEANGDLHFRASQFYRDTFRRMPTKELRQKYLDLRRAELETAAKTCKPTDQYYAESRVQLSELLAAEGKIPEAEKICREAVEQRTPQEMFVRRKLALLIASRNDRRDEAIALLAAPLQLTPAQKSGLRGARFKDFELIIATDLANLRLDKVAATENPEERAALMKQVNDTIALLAVRAPDWPLTARIQGKAALVNNNPKDAIQFLQKAVNGLPDNGAEKYEAMYLLANANRQGAQYGTAKGLLKEVVDKFPTYVPARLMLTEMYMRESDLTSAKPHIEILQKSMPDSPRVKKMSIALLVEQKAPPEQIAKMYAQLPEKTRTDRMEKAVIAVLTKDIDDAKRLLDLVLKDDPSDVEAAVSLSRLLDKQKNDRAAAVAVMDAVAKLKPNDPNVILEQKRLTGATAEQMQGETQTIIQDSLTGVERELALMEIERLKKNLPGMMEHLKKAEELAPNDTRVLDLYFTYALRQNDWDMANKYLQKLGSPDINADKMNGQYYRWRLATAQGDLAKALEIASAIQRDYGAFALSYVALAQTQQQMGKYDEAMTNFTQAAEKQPQNADARRGLIECSYARNRPQEAKKYIDQALQIFRNDPQFQSLADDWDLKYGEPDKALATREANLQKNPDAREAYMQLGMGYIEAAKVKDTQTNAQAKKDLLNKSKDVFQRAIAKFPDEVAFTSNYASAALLLDEYPSAKTAWETLAARDAYKDKIETMQLLTDFYCNAGHFDDAEKSVRDYMAKHPDQVDARFALSAVHAWQKKYDLAAADLGESDDPRLVSRKIQLLITGGNLDQAEKLLAPIAASGHASVDQLNQLGYIYQKQHKSKQAMDVLNQVLAQDPQNGTALLYRSAALLDQPQTNLDDLIRDLTAVRQANPGNVEARKLLAEAYRRKGDLQASLRELEDLSRVTPTDKVPWQLLLSAYTNARPPRWNEAERVADEIKQVPELANDIDMLLAISQMEAARGKAQDSKEAFQKSLVDIEKALRQQPKNQLILQVFYTVMIQGKAYPQLLNHTEQMPPEIRSLWWIKQDRAICRARLKDTDGAAKEFNDALNQCLAAKDDASALLVVNSMASELGVPYAIKLVDRQVQGGNWHWQMLAANLQQRNGDIPAARKIVDQVMGGLDKLSLPEQAQILGYAGVLFMVDPDPDMKKAKAIYERLTTLRPDDYLVWNNLACMRDITPAQSLEYSQRAVDLMRRTGKPEPYVLDTHGWNLVQANRLDEGINALTDAWAIEQFPDLAYHLAVANIKKGNLDEAERNLKDARELFQKKLADKTVTNMKLDDDINTAVKDLRDARARAAQGADAAPGR